MRDYANKNRRSSSSPRRPGLLVMSFVLILLAFSLPFALVYMHHKAMLGKNIAQNKNPTKTAAVEKAKDPSQQFDFYTLLPKMAVPNNAPDEKKSS